MENKIRFGVLGCAGIAVKHVIPAMIHACNAEPYAIASRSQEKVDSAIAEFGFKKGYMSYDDVLSDPDVDAVYIPLPNALHKEWVIKAANAGKHILCEKPLGLGAFEVEEMIETAQRNNVKLMEAYMYRFTSRTQKLKELLDNKVVGEISQVISNYSFYLEDYSNIRVNSSLGGGSLHDVGCYPVNLLGWITNDYPKSIVAQMIEKNGVDISLTASLRYKNGIMGTVNCSFLGESEEVTEITGTKGTLIIRDTYYDSNLPILFYSGDNETVYPVEACERYTKEIEAFSDCILNNKDVPLSLSESIRNNRLIEEIYKAAKNG